MELDDRWDPAPLPNGNQRSQVQPRPKEQAMRKTRPEPQYYEALQNPAPRETNQNAQMHFYDDISDDDNSSSGYPVVLRQPQVNQKRVRDPAPVAPHRRKRHQSEHPSGVGRGRTRNIEETRFDHSPDPSQSRNKSMARSDVRYKATDETFLDGYEADRTSISASRKSIARSHSRAGDSYQGQSHMVTEDYNEEYTRQPRFIASQSNDPGKRHLIQEPFYNSVHPSQVHRDSPRIINREQVVTPKPKQRRDYSRTQSVAQGSTYDDGGNLYLGNENVMSSARSQRQRQKPQLGSPLWSNHESTNPKPSPAARRLQGSIEQPTQINSRSLTPRNQSMGRKSVGPNGMQIFTSKPRGYEYVSINDDDINDTPLENDLRRNSNSKTKVENNPIEFLNALPKSSAFKSSNSQAAKQVYQTPLRDSNRAMKSGITIDLVTPETAVDTRGSMPFLPSGWSPHMKRPLKVSPPLNISKQDIPSADSLQPPAEQLRQVQAAEKIVRQELNAERAALQKDLFGEVVGETEEEKREREELKRAEAQKAREEREIQDAIDAETKRRKAELKAQKERERKEAEQAEKDKEVAARKAKRDAERHHQSLKEEQAAIERRNAIKKTLQEKKEREMAVQKFLDEQKQTSEKMEKETAAKLDQMARSMQQITAQLNAKTAASLIPARKSTADSGPTKAAEATVVEAPILSTILPTNMEIDEDTDSLFVPETHDALVPAPSDQQVQEKPPLQETPETQDENSNVNTTTVQPAALVQPVEQSRVPASMAEVFARAVPNPSSGKIPEDREAEREALRKQRAEERLASQRKSAQFVPPEPNPKTPTHKAAPIATSKASSKATQKKKSAKSLEKLAANSVFGVKLMPLQRPGAFVPLEQAENAKTVAEKPQMKLPSLKPRPLSLHIPPPLPPPIATKTSNNPETRLISQTEQDEIEANRQRIQAEAKARKDALNKQRADARKEEFAKNRTAKFRKNKEEQLKDQARKDGKELSEFELEAILEKALEKRERERKRRNQSRTEEKTSSSEHGHELVPNPTLPNIFGTTSAQVSSSDTASDFNHIDEDDDLETQSMKEHVDRTTKSMMALAQSRAARRSQPSTVEKAGPFFSDESEESEEDPEDEETLKVMMAQAQKNNAAKAVGNADEVQQEAQLDEDAFEGDLERDLEAAFANDVVIEGGAESATTALNPNDYGTQIVAPLPDMTSYFQGSSTQQSSNAMDNRPTQLSTTSQIAQPAPAKPQKPASYKMVNVYKVMTQLTLHDHEEEAILKKKFLDVDKANKYAQALVNEYRAERFMQQEIVETWHKDKYFCQITQGGYKITKVFVKAVPMSPKEVEKYDPREVNPKFANHYYTVRYAKTIEEVDPENEEVRIVHRTVGFVDASKLYTAWEMANHAAAEYLSQEVKPKEDIEEHHAVYQEILSQIRESRDDNIKEETLFCCELPSDVVPWMDFKFFEVSVDMSTTEGPIN